MDETHKLAPEIPLERLRELRRSIPGKTLIPRAMALWAVGVGKLMLEHPKK